MTTNRLRPVVDWETVEREYRAGIKSLMVIGKEHGVSDAGILKRARKAGWMREPGWRIRRMLAKWNNR